MDLFNRIPKTYPEDTAWDFYMEGAPEMQTCCNGWSQEAFNFQWAARPLLYLTASQPLPSPGTCTPIIKILWHTKHYIVFFLLIWWKNWYTFNSLTPDSYCVGCCHFLMWQSKGKEVCGTPAKNHFCKLNFKKVALFNCVIIWSHLRVDDRLQGIEELNPFKLLLNSFFTSLMFIILCEY